MQVITFAAAGGIHGIPVLAVEEFFRPVPMTPVPLADRCVAGLMNQRGKSATVLNLRACFHMLQPCGGVGCTSVPTQLHNACVP